MGFMDKVKAGAEQAVAKAQHGMAQGQEKLGEMQAKRAADGLLRELGAAYWAQQRTGGPAAAVDEAMAKLEAHVAEHGAIGSAADADEADSAQPAAPDASAYIPPQPPPPPPAP